MHVSVIYRHESHLCIILIHYTTHVFARKQCILCYAVRRKSYPILPYVTSLRVSFSISALELPRTALLCCRLAASRLREAARWQSSRSTTARKLGRWLYLCQYKYKLFCSKWIYLPTFFWSETLLGVNLPLARLSVRGYVCVSTRQQIFINFITPDDNRMIFTLRTTQASPVRKVLYGRRLPPIKSCRMTQTKHKMV